MINVSKLCPFNFICLLKRTLHNKNHKYSGAQSAQLEIEGLLVRASSEALSWFLEQGTLSSDEYRFNKGNARLD